MITGKTAERYEIYAFSCFPAKLVLNPAHCFDMHDPMSGKRHLNQTFYIFSAPVINKPESFFIFTDRTCFNYPFPIIIRKLSLQVCVLQLLQQLICGIHYSSAIIIQGSHIKFRRKLCDLLTLQLISGRDDRAVYPLQPILRE